MTDRTVYGYIVSQDGERAADILFDDVNDEHNFMIYTQQTPDHPLTPKDYYRAWRWYHRTDFAYFLA